MAQRAIQSLLPGAPFPESDRKSLGIHAIDLACSRAFEFPVDIDTVSDPDTCPANLLPWLAWAYSVDEWPDGMTVQEKRDRLKASRAAHQRKGTRAAALAILVDAGYPNADIQEGIDLLRYDGTYTYNAQVQYHSTGHWAYYRIILQQGDPVIDEATLARIDRAAPERSTLFEVIYV